MRGRNEIIEALIRDAEEKLEEARFYEHFYNMEVAKPKTIGKNEALDNLALYQKHVKSRETHLKLLLDYAKWISS